MLFKRLQVKPAIKKQCLGLLSISWLSLCMIQPGFSQPHHIPIEERVGIPTPPPLPPYELQIQPQTITQGQTFEVILKGGSTRLAPYTVYLADQKIPLYQAQDKGAALPTHHAAYLGIKADQKPGGYTLKILDKNGSEVAKDKIEVKPGSFYTQNIRFYRPKLSPEVEAKIKEEEALVDAAALVRSPQALWKGPFIKPVPHRITSAYGTRRYLNGKYNGYHSGIDFASPHGYAIKAPANARVTLARYFSKYNANGNTVFLDHGQGITSVYIHLSKIPVQEGQMVKKGETIGYIGTTGRSTGPHLHWGMYINGHNTDGLKWISHTQKHF